jgi:hypothetical protein
MISRALLVSPIIAYYSVVSLVKDIIIRRRIVRTVVIVFLLVLLVWCESGLSRRDDLDKSRINIFNAIEVPELESKENFMSDSGG